MSPSIHFIHLSETGVLSRHTAPDKMAVDWLRKDITEAMATTNESSVLPCFQFNKFVDIEVKDDLQIQTLGWTNIEEAFDTGMDQQTRGSHNVTTVHCQKRYFRPTVLTAE